MMIGLICLALAWLIYDMGRLRQSQDNENTALLARQFAARQAKWKPVSVSTGPLEYPGAVPPNRFVVVRWPGEVYHYQGCQGAQARQIYEHNHPKPGESVEFWELGTQRGRKVG